jgi:hypothetical protein
MVENQGKKFDSFVQSEVLLTEHLSAIKLFYQIKSNVLYYVSIYDSTYRIFKIKNK